MNGIVVAGILVQVDVVCVRDAVHTAIIIVGSHLSGGGHGTGDTSIGTCG